jgi:hypothetical protein
VASDGGKGTKNSPFTVALLEHLSDPDDIAVVLRRVREKVKLATGGKQVPWDYGSLTGGALIIRMNVPSPLPLHHQPPDHPLLFEMIKPPSRTIHRVRHLVLMRAQYRFPHRNLPPHHQHQDQHQYQNQHNACIKTVQTTTMIIKIHVVVIVHLQPVESPLGVKISIQTGHSLLSIHVIVHIEYEI